jgi:hypothetical protein
MGKASVYLLRRIGALLVIASAPGSAAASELLLKRSGHHIVEAWIDNRPVRLRVDPESPGYIILNGRAAWRLRLYPTLVSAATIIGPVRVEGSSRIAQVFVGGVTSARRVIWTDREAVDGADGIISPAAIPVERITMQFRTPQVGETQVGLPMLFSQTLGLYHPFAMAGKILHFRISTGRTASLATAAAGGVLAQHHVGSWSGDARGMMIKYGIVRPVRPLALERAASVGSQPLTSLLVRTSDHRGGAVLPADRGLDADEIVVTALRNNQQPRYLVSLGLDWLRQCSSISWNNRTRRMTMSCTPAGSEAAPAAGAPSLMGARDPVHREGTF